MNSIDTQLLERYRAAAAVLADLPGDAALYAGASESALLEVNQLFATSQVALRSGGAFIAGEIAHRSAPELGSQGWRSVRSSHGGAVHQDNERGDRSGCGHCGAGRIADAGGRGSLPGNRR
jgi:hypothetical protein